MINKLVKEQIELYLEYSSVKGISIDDYIKIRRQAVEEYSLNIPASSLQMITSDESHKIQAGHTERQVEEPHKVKNTPKPSKITHIEDAGKSKQADFLQILKSVEE